MKEIKLLKSLIKEMSQVQTRKLGIKRELPIDILKSYVKSPPEYAIRESNVERPLYNPRSKVDKINETPLGTYAYPLSEEIFNMLVNDKLRDFGDKYMHLFKIPEKGMLYLGEKRSDITDIQIIKFIRLLNNNLSIEQASQFIKHPHYKNDSSKNDLLYTLIKDVNFQVEVGVFNKKHQLGTGMYSERGLRTNHPKIAKALLSIGVNGFVDLDHGIMFDGGNSAESQQLVIINPSLAQSSFIRSFDYKSLISHTTVFSRAKGINKVNDKYVKKFIERLGPDEAFRRIWQGHYTNYQKISKDSWVWNIYNPEKQSSITNDDVFLNPDTPVEIKRKQYLKVKNLTATRVIIRDDQESLHNIPLIKALIKNDPYFFKRFMMQIADQLSHEESNFKLEDHKDLIKELLSIQEIYDYYYVPSYAHSSKFELLLDDFSHYGNLIKNIYNEIRREKGDPIITSFKINI